MKWIQNRLEAGMFLLLPMVLGFGCQSTSNTDLGEYDASMNVKRIAAADRQPDQYLVEMLVWRQCADGGKALVSAPQVLVVEGREAICEIGSAATNGMRCCVLVKELDGKKVGRTAIECFENGGVAWRKTLEAEAVSASAQ